MCTERRVNVRATVADMFFVETQRYRQDSQEKHGTFCEICHNIPLLSPNWEHMFCHTIYLDLCALLENRVVLKKVPSYVNQKKKSGRCDAFTTRKRQTIFVPPIRNLSTRWDRDIPPALADSTVYKQNTLAYCTQRLLPFSGCRFLHVQLACRAEACD